MTKPGRALGLAVLACGLAGSWSGAARAQGDDVATAQVLFDDGKRLMSQGHWAEACPKLQESQRLAAAIGTEFNLADCWEHAGRLASAWAAFLDVVDQTHRRGEAPREAAARSRASSLAARLGKLTVQVPPASTTQGLEVSRDGEALPPEIWGVAVPVDAGEHRIEARAPGHLPWSTRVTTTDGAGATTVVPTLALAPAATPSPTAPVSSPPAPSTAASRAPSPPPPAPATADHTASLVVLGAGLAFAGLGVVGVLEHTSSVDAYNSDTTCPAIGSAVKPAHCNDYVNQANTWSTVSVVAFVTSGIAVAAGVTLWLLAPSRDTSAQAASLGCALGPAALGCHGTF